MFAFAFFYVLAVFILLTGTFGWFSQPRDPLSGVFLLPLGFPWVFVSNYLPDMLRPWWAIASPLLNLFILFALCRRSRSNGH
ncbi:MAG: hypothetical protein AAF709_07180 [Pseudomonadota bacterium]